MKMIETSISSFEAFVEENYLYVDKTGYLLNLVKRRCMVFFARPRRFGKTLLMNALDDIFQGKRELFKGLAIDKSDYDWKKYPVIHIDFASCSKKTAAELASWINKRLLSIAKELKVSLPMDQTYDDNFLTLIETLGENNQVVILVDEYDRMLLNNLFNPELEEIRDLLKGFFDVIKGMGNYIRFCFITGITEFAKVGVFSTMNNLTDYTLDEDFAYMYGYTQEELEENFADYIEKGIKDTGMDRATYLSKIKEKYDGYGFSPHAGTVYNPVSIGLFFSRGKGKYFRNFWMDTGGMQMLMDVSKLVNFDIIEDLESPIAIGDLSSFDVLEVTSKHVDKDKLKALLLQTGYLTIVHTDRMENLYLGFPNSEVRSAFCSSLLKNYLSEEQAFNENSLLILFEDGDTSKAIKSLKETFSSMTYPEGTKKRDEDFYQSMFFMALRAVGATVKEEVHTNKGRIDAVLECPKHVYVFEFKVDKSAEEALCQIKEKGYAEQFQLPSGKTVHLIGINFSTAERNIVDWKEEKLPS